MFVLFFSYSSLLTPIKRIFAAHAAFNLLSHVTLSCNDLKIVKSFPENFTILIISKHFLAVPISAIASPCSVL
jgi:hypothetical protein